VCVRVRAYLHARAGERAGAHACVRAGVCACYLHLPEADIIASFQFPGCSCLHGRILQKSRACKVLPLAFEKNSWKGFLAHLQRP
jgi:hypothetical protein